MQLDIETLKYVKTVFDTHNDTSSMINGYRSLCKMIEDNENLTAEQANYRTKKFIKNKIFNDINLAGKLILIQEQIELGEYEVELFDDDDIREKLTSLGYVCSESYQKRNDVYMMVSWKDEN